MSKELEALEKIDHTICLAFNDNNKALFNKDNETHIDCKDIDEFCDCYDIIETALKDYQTLKREYDFGVEHYNELLNQYNKEHKALEIIKNKNVSIVWLKNCNMQN